MTNKVTQTELVTQGSYFYAIQARRYSLRPDMLVVLALYLCSGKVSEPRHEGCTGALNIV